MSLNMQLLDKVNKKKRMAKELSNCARVDSFMDVERLHYIFTMVTGHKVIYAKCHVLKEITMDQAMQKDILYW